MDFWKHIQGILNSSRTKINAKEEKEIWTGAQVVFPEYTDGKRYLDYELKGHSKPEEKSGCINQIK